MDNQHRIKVLMVDDQRLFGETVRLMLSDQADIDFYFCDNATEALSQANQIKPTVILQDLMMPDVDGLTMVKFFRAAPSTKDVPMIVLSAREEADIKYQAFSFGANDYMVKLPDKLEVLARIRYHSKAYINLLEKNEAYRALVESQAALKAELAEAERYIKSLLPLPFEDKFIKADWLYTPSTDLAGDAFGYHWLDEDNFAIYLLDVCGHGVGAALLSVSAINTLRSQSLASVDYKNPASVLSGLNEAFDMDKQNQMYFTLWYGIYNKNSRQLTYASGGHPPAILINHSGKAPKELKTPGLIIGGMPGAPFQTAMVEVNVNDTLYVFSDGMYEVTSDDGSITMSFSDFVNELNSNARPGYQKLQSMVLFAKGYRKKNTFEDDLTMMEICFH